MFIMISITMIWTCNLLQIFIYLQQSDIECTDRGQEGGAVARRMYGSTITLYSVANVLRRFYYEKQISHVVSAR